MVEMEWLKAQQMGPFIAVSLTTLSIHTKNCLNEASSGKMGPLLPKLFFDHMLSYN